MDEKYYECEKFENIKSDKSVFEDYEFIDCEFDGCTFDECKLLKCTFSGCQFYRCSFISIQAEYSQMKNCGFIKCNLIGIHWNDFLPAGGIAEPIRKIQDCCLKYNTFIKMNFRKFDFTGSVITESTFEGCNVAESSFRECKLEGTQYNSCDMRKADFRDAAGYQIDIMDNKMKDARFSFPEVIRLFNVLGIKID